jgi:HAD superfamily hydrolase (TIGR01509 family)
MIASNNSSQIITEFLTRNKLEELFIDVITPDCGYRPKPNSDIYKECFKRMELPTESVLVIEDSQTGILAAESAGLKSLFLPFPKFQKDITFLTNYFD